MEVIILVEKLNLSDLMNAMHGLSRTINTREAFGNIPRAEFFVMALLDEHTDVRHIPGNPERGNGMMTVTQIANIMEMTTPAASKLLRIIEGKGYIARVLDDKDRRVVYIRLTEKGSALITASKKKAEEKTAKILEKLGEEDARELIRIFGRLRAIVQEAHEEQKVDCCGRS